MDVRKIADPAKAAVAEDFFANCVRAVAKPIDPRMDQELLVDAENHANPAVREHSAYEYIYRHERDAFAVVLKLYEAEEDHRVQTSLFEELSRLDYDGFAHYIRMKGVPSRLEPFAYARFGREMTAARAGHRRTTSDAQELFDQCIPLRVSLREYIEVEPKKWMYHVFSPLQEEAVAGQLVACSKVETRDKRIVLSKQLKGLHADNSLHIENTLFNGRTVYLDEYTTAFSYKTNLKIPFYPSGRIGDRSEGVIPDAEVNVLRVGTILLDREIKIRGIPAINNVTGIIRTWGYTRPDKATFDPAGRMDLIAGLFHLGDLIDPRTRDYVNSYTIGTYRGVVAEEEDGVIGLNTRPSYATIDGLIDRNRDGVAENEGEHYDLCPEIHPIEYYTANDSRPLIDPRRIVTGKR
jgi:hypothetical protein